MVITIFSTIAALIAAIVTVTQVANDLFKVTNSTAKLHMAWAVGIILAIIGYVANLGIFADYGAMNEWQSWVMTVATGWLCGLGANGTYDAPKVRQLIELIENLIRPTKTSK